jgi:hypothetical protein
MRIPLRLFLVVLAPMLVATSVKAQSFTLGSLLSGGDVTPNKVLTGGVAFADLTIDWAKSEIAYEINAYNLPNGVTGAHIHVGAPGVVGPVLFDLRPTPNQSGDFTLRGTLSAADLTARPELGVRDIIDALETVMGVGTYVDVHTSVRADGEIRGLLFPVDDSTATRSNRLLFRSLTHSRR